ncbi:hypothetical protein WJX74_005415 [Apatococcus lobatus]|uniref:Pre-mRNA-splicing factor SLU7 n=1 Tax=Apatococcus lobatus TaxID=904363 RepID=A0AAW1QKU9_9CHLO
MASANTLFKSHEEYRRNKELEEARKAGIAPAAVDEEGKEINPHIPQYMSSAPWYLNDNRPSLKHQKNWREGEADAGKQYDRGVKVFQAKKFRKGACENCGAMSHKTKDCMDRPRSKGAKWTGKHIAADEKVQDINMSSFDAKRDLWNGYNPDSYTRVVDMYEKVEEQKRQIRKKQELEKRFNKDDAKDHSSSDEEEDDEDKINETQEAGFGKVEKRVRTTAGGASGSVRNLRIREDTAKYLLNLDPTSAHYDPKSRSMREDPNPMKNPQEKSFMGDNFVRKSGDYHQWEALTLHSFQAHDRGQDMHVQAAPSQAEAYHRSFKSRKELLEQKSKASVVEKYGNAAEAPDSDALLLGQTEKYLEYDAAGRVIKGQEVKAQSCYEEDVLINNHTCVWGSWWQEGTWGYACCHQSIKNSYCTGEAGLAAAEETALQMQQNLEHKAAEQQARAAALDSSSEPSSSKQLDLAAKKGIWGSEVSEDVQLDKDKLQAALKKAAEKEQEEAENDERKRKYNSMSHDTEVTNEDMEAYRMVRSRADDPLNEMQALKNSQYGYV